MYIYIIFVTLYTRTHSDLRTESGPSCGAPAQQSPSTRLVNCRKLGKIEDNYMNGVHTSLSSHGGNIRS